MADQMREKRKVQKDSLGDKLGQLLENTLGETAANAARRAMAATAEDAFDKATQSVAGDDAKSRLTQGLLTGLKTSVLGVPVPPKPATLKTKILRKLNSLRVLFDS